MGKSISKEKVIANKKRAIKRLDRLLEDYIGSGKDELVKKANLISYWIKTFSDYIDFEDKFDPRRIISYSRGDVIRVNFGFKVGSELGGLHFAVVLDNDNKQIADVLTVIPLSSTDGREVHERSVDLGVELYEKVKSVQEGLLDKVTEDLEEANKYSATLERAIELFKSTPITEEDKDSVKEVIRLQKETQDRIDHINNEISIIKRNDCEIAKMKSGSMAVMNQITTISKQRIFTPKKSEDFLYGVSLSKPAMEKINLKLIELYCRG